MMHGQRCAPIYGKPKRAKTYIRRSFRTLPFGSYVKYDFWAFDRQLKRRLVEAELQAEQWVVPPLSKLPCLLVNPQPGPSASYTWNYFLTYPYWPGLQDTIYKHLYLSVLLTNVSTCHVSTYSHISHLVYYTYQLGYRWLCFNTLELGAHTCMINIVHESFTFDLQRWARRIKN